MDSQVPTQEQNIPQPPVPVAEEKNNDWFKILLIVVGFLVIIGLFSNIYLLLRKEKQKPTVQIPPTSTQTTVLPTPALDPTANWKIYRNSEYNFEFKYPANLSFGPLGTPVPLAFSLTGDSVAVTFSLYPMDVPSSYDWVVGHGPQGKTSIIYFPNAINIREAKRGAYQTVEFEDVVPKEPRQENVVFSKENYAYVFSLFKPSDESKEVFDQILSTFKFLSLPNSSPTPSLKEYVNKKLGFLVKYPDNWFSNDCGFVDVLLLLNPNGKPVCETEPYDPIILNTKPVYIESFTQLDFKVTLKEEKTTPVKYSKFLIEKLQPAPGPDKFLILRVLLPNGGMFTITVNDLQYELIADQILSAFQFLD